MKQYVVQAIKQKQITYGIVNDEIEESPIMGKTILKGCRENSLKSNTKKAKFKKVEDRIMQVSKDPLIREEAREDEKKNGRLASQSEMTERENLSKTVRTVSPKSS